MRARRLLAVSVALLAVVAIFQGGRLAEREGADFFSR
jgi:hypothetical protein